LNLRRALAVGIGSTSVLIAVGCSALISADLGRVNCVAEGAVGPPACPLGKTCRAGICTFCAPYETCANQFDDDCNGVADDGCDDGGLGGTGGGAGAGGVGADGGTSGGAGAPPGGGGTAGSAPGGGGTGGAVIGLLGDPCQKDGDCANGTFCSPPDVHGATGSTPICVVGCCSSDECGASEVCYPAAGGYGVCLPASAAGRPAIGTKLNGSACASDGECRSAMCDGSICIDVCCSNGDCPGNAPACALRAEKFTGRSSFLCSQKTGAAFNTGCNDNAECQSKACLDLRCTQSCCAANDCLLANYSCIYGIEPAGATVRVCAQVNPGPNPNGVACSNSNECQSGWCIDTGSGGFCSDTCCQDGDCGDPTKFGCRTLTPIDPPGSPALLFCVKR
jgi:hypothetical protein